MLSVKSFLLPGSASRLYWWTKEESQKWPLNAQKQAEYVLDNPYVKNCDDKYPTDVERESEMIGTSIYEMRNGCPLFAQNTGMMKSQLQKRVSTLKPKKSHKCTG